MIAYKKIDWSDIADGDRVKKYVGKIMAGELSLKSARLNAPYKVPLAMFFICEDFCKRNPYIDKQQLLRKMVKQKNHHHITISFVFGYRDLVNSTFGLNYSKEMLSDALHVFPMPTVEEYRRDLNREIRSKMAEIKSRERQLIMNKRAQEREDKVIKSCIDKEYAATAFRSDFIKKAEAKFGNRYQYMYLPASIDDDVKCLCSKHGCFTQRADVFLRGHGCPECVGVVHLSAEERADRFIHLSKQRYGDQFDYSYVLYVDKNTPVLLRCKKHNELFSILPDTHVRRNGGCPYCKDSVGQTEVRLVLELYRINFVAEYIVPNENPDCRRSHLRVDFYLPDQNIFIEFNGQQHYEEISHFHSTKDWTFEDQQIRDQTLRDYCTKHNIHLIEIRYDQMDDIEEILKRELHISTQSDQ